VILPEAKLAEAVDGLLYAVHRLGKCRNALPAARMHAADAAAAIARMKVAECMRTLDLPLVGSIIGACPELPYLP